MLQQTVFWMHSNLCCWCLADGTDDTVLGFHTADFWLNICVCHSLIVEHKEGAPRPTFQVGPALHLLSRLGLCIYCFPYTLYQV